MTTADVQPHVNYAGAVTALTFLAPEANNNRRKQESPAIADKPARRESMPKGALIRRAYNVVADILA